MILESGKDAEMLLQGLEQAAEIMSSMISVSSKRALADKKEQGYNYLIEVDGSCNKNTYQDLLEAGAEVLIVGSSGLFNLDPELTVAWDKMIADIRQAEQAA